MTAAYSRAQFCEAFGISRGLLARLIAVGKGPKIMRVGRRVLISQQAADEWRMRLERETTPDQADDPA